VTAGFGMEGDIVEYRGRSFSAGGDPGAITMPNLMRELAGNARLAGFSLGDRPGVHTSDAGCQGRDVEVCRLNAAVDGANMRRVLRQVAYLDGALLPGERREWKVVTLFAGLADVVFSDGSGSTPPSLFRAQFRELLRAVASRLGGRVYLNVLALPQRLQRLSTMLRTRLGCRLLFELSHLPLSPVRWNAAAGWALTAAEYNRVLEEEVSAFQRENRAPDFRVEMHRFMRDAELSDELLEHLDCLHPNAVLARNMSVALWNSMLGAHQTTIFFAAEPLCPSEGSRLR